MHKIANVLDALPKSVHGMAKKDRHALDQAKNRVDAENALERFTGNSGAKHEKRVTGLAKDHVLPRVFDDFAAQPLRNLLTASRSSNGSKASRPLMDKHVQLEPDREHRRDGARPQTRLIHRAPLAANRRHQPPPPAHYGR
jgi:hypothetical protein